MVGGRPTPRKGKHAGLGFKMSVWFIGVVFYSFGGSFVLWVITENPAADFMAKGVVLATAAPLAVAAIPDLVGSPDLHKSSMAKSLFVFSFAYAVFGIVVPVLQAPRLGILTGGFVAWSNGFLALFACCISGAALWLFHTTRSR